MQLTLLMGNLQSFVIHIPLHTENPEGFQPYSHERLSEYDWKMDLVLHVRKNPPYGVGLCAAFQVLFTSSTLFL